MKTDNSFGAWLRNFRQEHDLTQETSAEKLGFSSDYIRKLESGSRPLTSSMAKALAKFLALQGDEYTKFVAELLRCYPSSDRRDSAPGVSPYKGLQFFAVEDAHLFYGRAQLTAELIDHLRQDRFLAVVGASGSGKSSLVRAGLVASLQRGSIPGIDVVMPKGCQTWPMYLFTPGPRPLESLAVALTQQNASVTTTSTLIDDLRKDARSLHLYVNRLFHTAPATQLLIVVDQFEELFTLCHDTHEQHAFVDALLTAALDYDRTLVVITLRADFYAHCADFEKLRAALDNYQKYIGPMEPPELQQAIEAPATQGEWTIEPGLTQQMLTDVSDEPGRLPLLSHALDETWQRRQGRQLTLAGYVAAGGVKGAIAQTANTLYHELSPEQQVIARAIFLRLTELGEGVQDTRRRVPRTELQFQHTDPETVTFVLKALADARLVTTDTNEVQVMHEAVIREWPLLREWLADDREGLRTHRRLTESANEWHNADFDESLLYRGVRLAQALARAQEHAGELNTLERKFLETSQSVAAAAQAHEVEQQRLLAEGEAKRAKLAEERAREAIEYAKQKEVAAQQLQRGRNLLAVASLLALILAGLAGLLSVQAGRNATHANHQRSTAMAAQATAEANRGMALQQQNVAQARATVAVAAQATAEVSAQRAHADRLAMQARVASMSTDRNELDRALLIASLAVTRTWAEEGYVLPNADLALREAIDAAQRQRWRPILELLHSAAVFTVAYSPDSQLLASAGADQKVHIWAVASGQEVRQLTGHTGSVRSAVFSSDGQLIASASEDKTVRVWAVTSGNQIRQLTGHTDSVTAVRFSPNGQQLVSASADGTVRIWEVASGQEVRQLRGHAGAVWAAAFHPNGQLIISAGADKTARIWDVASGLEVRQLTNHQSIVWSAEFSPNGEWMMTASEDEKARIWNATSGQEIHRVNGDTSAVDETGNVRAAAFSPDGQQVVGAIATGMVLVWKVSSERVVQQLVGHSAAGSAVAFSPNGQQIASGDEDGMVLIWDATGNGAMHQLAGHTDSVRQATFNPDGEQIVSASEDTTIRLWDVVSGQEMRQLVGHTDSVRSAVFTPDGQQIVSASEDGTVRIWDAVSGKEMRQLTGHAGAVWSAAVSPDGTQIASGGQDTTVRIWDTVSGQEVRQLVGNEESIWSVAFSPDGKWLVSTCENGIVRVWDVASGKEVHRLTGHVASAWSARFSPDGQQIVSAGDDGTVRIWDVASGQELRQLLGHTAGVRSAVFSPDGKQVVSASADKTVRLWDVASGQEMRQLVGHTERVLSIAYSPDGQQIVSASTDTTARLWVASIDELLAQAQSLIQREPPLLTPEEKQQYGLE